MTSGKHAILSAVLLGPLMGDRASFRPRFLVVRFDSEAKRNTS